MEATGSFGEVRITGFGPNSLRGEPVSSLTPRRLTGAPADLTAGPGDRGAEIPLPVVQAATGNGGRDAAPSA